MHNTDMPTRAELPTTTQLLRSTAIAIATAAVLLVTIVLPAEYAIDPTGIGRVLGLTEMGGIKQQLAAEASVEEDATQVAADVSADPEPAELASPATDAPTAQQPEKAAVAWRDTVTLTLAPGEAAEVKLSMKKGEVASYEWSASQGHVNSDLHADGTGGLSTSYRKGRAESRDAGELLAAFDGSHGWFWRNRSDAPVELTLKTRGAYAAIKRII